MNRLFFGTCLFVSMVLPLLAQGPQRTLNGNTFIDTGQGWHQRDHAGRLFPLDPSIITVKFNDSAARAAQEELHASLGGEVVRIARTGFMDIRIPAGRDVLDVVSDYSQSDLIVSAEPNTFGTYTAIPNDPSYTTQWQWQNLQASEAWDLQTGSVDVIVAVLDSGTEFNHQDMGDGGDGYQNIWLNPAEDAWSDPSDPNTGDGVDNDNNGYVDDWKGFDFANNNNDSSGTNGHGTNVGGLIGAKTNNGTGIAGLAGGWNGVGTRLMICGVGDSGPVGSILDDAILYAAEHGAKVIQLSLTVIANSAIDAALESAYNDGVFIVCAAGNSGSPTIGYPSNHPRVLAVGSTDINDNKSNFSNFGPDLDVAAPGSAVFTTTLGNGYSNATGTSFSAPITSGLVALLFAANPSLTNAEILDILTSTADKVGSYNYNWNASMPGHSQETGYGRINAFRAVEAAASLDVFIKDSLADTGGEPNTASGNDLFASPDLWNCVDDPSCNDHQNPVFGAQNTLRARIHNRRNTPSSQANLRLYWTAGSMAARWPDHWLDPNDPNNPGTNSIGGQPAGGEITVVDQVGFAADPVLIPVIDPNASVIVSRSWNPPDPSHFPLPNAASNMPSIGFLARIEAAADPMANEVAGHTKANVVNNNNIANNFTAMVQLKPSTPAAAPVSTYVRRSGTGKTQLDLLVEAVTSVDGVAYPGNVILVLDSSIWNAWVTGGSQGQGVTVLQDFMVEITDPANGGRLNNISIGAGDVWGAGMAFALSSPGAANDDGVYTFRLTHNATGTSDVLGSLNARVSVQALLDVVQDRWPDLDVLDLIGRVPLIVPQ